MNLLWTTALWSTYPALCTCLDTCTCMLYTKYSVAGNFHGVQRFAVFTGRPATANITTTKILTSYLHCDVTTLCQYWIAQRFPFRQWSPGGCLWSRRPSNSVWAILNLVKPEWAPIIPCSPKDFHHLSVWLTIRLSNQPHPITNMHMQIPPKIIVLPTTRVRIHRWSQALLRSRPFTLSLQSTRDVVSFSYACNTQNEHGVQTWASASC